MLNNQIADEVIHFAEKKEKPTVTKPADVEVAEQEDVVFETTVTGLPEPIVEWWV